MSKDIEVSKDLVNKVIHLLKAGCDLTVKHKVVCPYCKEDYVKNRACKAIMKKNRYGDHYDDNGEPFDNVKCVKWYVARLTGKVIADLC